MQRTPTFNNMTQPFVPAGWCRNAHLQTLWPQLFRRQPQIKLKPERLELPDGDFIDLCWTDNQTLDAPLVVVIHGLQGSLQSHYAKGILLALTKAGLRAVFMHLRGCSGEPNRLARSYHSGFTEDLAYLLQVLQDREPETPFAAIGFSLGGNILLKWLGETGDNNPLSAAVAVSVPFQLDVAARNLETGFSRLYQWVLIKRLQRAVQEKFGHMSTQFDPGKLKQLKTFYQFDDAVTAPLHGFSGADDYYAQSSSRQYLHGIKKPTLILQASDDPFMGPGIIPSSDELSTTIELELYRHGGHIGFVSGKWPWQACYWLDSRIPDYLNRQLGNCAH